MTSKTALLSTRNILMRNLVLPALVAGVFLVGLPGSISAYQLDKNRSKWEVLPVPLIVDNEQDTSGAPVIFNETVAAAKEWNTAGATFFGLPTSAATDLNGTNFQVTDGWGFLTGDSKHEVVYELDSDLVGSAWDKFGLNRNEKFASAVAITAWPPGNGPITDAFIIVHGSRLTAQGGDLQAVVTHELGHVVGLKHSSVLLATSTIAVVPLDRRPTLSPGAMQVSDRTLEADDKAAVVDLYDIAGYAKIIGTVKRCGSDAPVVAANVRAVVSGNQGV